MNSNLAYQDEFQEELINGETVAMAPGPAWNHISISGNIYNIFSNYLYRKKCTPIPDGFDLFLTEKDRFIPDMMVVCDPDKISGNGVHGAPDLVVEVLSPSTAKNDRGRKMKVYGECGVREYWIVNPGDKMIEQYFLDGKSLVLHEIYAIHPDFMLDKMTDAVRAAVVKEFRCSLFPDLTIKLEDIF